MIGVLRLLLAAYMAVLVSSCNTTRKLQSSHTEMTDSSRVVITDSTGVKKTDSTHVIIQTITKITDTGSTVVTEIIIEPDTNYHADYPARESDYYSLDSSSRKIRIKGVDFDLGKFRPGKITFRETVTKRGRDNINFKFLDSAKLATNDSTRLQKKDTTHIAATVTDKSKTTKRTRVPVPLQVGIILLLIFLLLIFFRKKTNR